MAIYIRLAWFSLQKVSVVNYLLVRDILDVEPLLHDHVLLLVFSLCSSAIHNQPIFFLLLDLMLEFFRHSFDSGLFGINRVRITFFSIRNFI